MGPHGGLVPSSPGEQPDQVPRLRKFLADHPGWKIGLGADGIWEARNLTEGGSHVVVNYTLHGLLNALAAPYPDPGS
ncbi:hypothetical protein [Trebonia sp.]|uniref:hypothetical protein n=1 Tax=Trebonia sp. TaxID=2767075 RepID=UPI00261E9E05|nr:hypothetical protein [Trebonia sp.]